ncbi:MAG: hypothetical protein QM765_34285 [Myxococcales bacterium]
MDGVDALAQLAFPALEVLAIRHGKLGDEGADLLGAATGLLRSLRALDLRKNGLHTLGALASGTPSLAVLELSGNPLGGRLADWLGAVTSPLEVLGFEGCGLKDADVEALVRAPCWKHLGVLDLRKNDLGDRSAQLMAQAPNRLRTLFVGGNRLTKAGKAALAALSARVHA